MNCGGFNTQWNINGGKCGICGEGFNSEKLFEKGGRLYVGTIVRTFYKNCEMKVTAEITAPHRGYIEFRICNIDNVQGDATFECFEQNILRDKLGNSRFTYSQGKNTYSICPPKNFVCNHCVLQVSLKTGFIIL